MEVTSNRKITHNTIVLFIRMFIVMTINLFAVRLTLQALGVEDYGIYNVVSGFVSMFSCLSSVLASATQRYYSFYLGTSNIENLKHIFSASLIIYIVFSIVIFVVGETIGLWFVNTQLVIPEVRMIAANYIYQFAIISFIVSMVVVPFSAAVVAHECFNFFAIVSLFDCVLRFFLILSLKYVSPDRLILYGFFLMVAQIVVLLLYYFFCKKRYSECSLVRVNEKNTYKELLSFSGWTLFGSIAGMGMMQINTILVNIFFGPICNAARAIALQVYTAILQLSSNFIMSVRPPMIKNYADGNISELNSLFALSNKIIFLLMSISCIPLYFEMPFILKIWLGDVSDDTILFSRLMVLYSFFLVFSNPITIIMQAMGRVKEYFVPVEMITLLCAPLTYVLFRLGLPAESTFEAMIICILGSHIVRLHQLKKYYSEFSLTEYFKTVVLFSIFSLIITLAVVYMVSVIIENPWAELITVIFTTFVMIGGSVFFIGMSPTERDKFLKLIFRKRMS